MTSQTAHRADYQALKKHFHRSVVDQKKKFAIPYLNFAYIFFVFGVTEEHMQLEALTALRKVILHQQMIEKREIQPIE